MSFRGRLFMMLESMLRGSHILSLVLGHGSGQQDYHATITLKLFGQVSQSNQRSLANNGGGTRPTPLITIQHPQYVKSFRNNYQNHTHTTGILQNKFKYIPREVQPRAQATPTCSSSVQVGHKRVSRICPINQERHNLGS